MKQRLLRVVFIGPIVSVALAGRLLLLSLRLGRTSFRDASRDAQVGAVDREDCAKDPSDWGWASGELSLYAYDRSGRSSNPEAPPMEQDLLERSTKTGRFAERIVNGRITWVRSSTASGPCAVLRGTTRDAEAIIAPRLLTVLATSIAGGMLLAAAGAYGLVVLPLRTRIDVLARAARGAHGPLRR